MDVVNFEQYCVKHFSFSNSSEHNHHIANASNKNELKLEYVWGLFDLLSEAILKEYKLR